MTKRRQSAIILKDFNCQTEVDAKQIGGKYVGPNRNNGERTKTLVPAKNKAKI